MRMIAYPVQDWFSQLKDKWESIGNDQKSDCSKILIMD